MSVIGIYRQLRQLSTSWWLGLPPICVIAR